MRKFILFSLIPIILISCRTASPQQASGTMLGMQLGSMVGGAVGNVTSRSRSGFFMGTAVGAVMGAVLGNTLNAPQSVKETKQAAVVRTTENEKSSQETTPSFEIKNVTFITDDGDKILTSGEVSKLSFEIYNTGAKTIYEIYPLIQVQEQADHITISPMTQIEYLNSGEGLKYTSTILADKSLKSGVVTFLISLSVGESPYVLYHKMNISTIRQ